MHMDVENRLTAMGIAIHHYPVTILCNAMFRCDFLCGKK